MIKVKKVEKKTKLIGTTVTESDLETIKKISESYGLSVSSYLRQVISEQIKLEAKSAN